MKRLFVVALVTAGLAGCAQWPDLRAISSNQPKIYVTTENLLVVDQDPIVFSLTENSTVTWHLPPDRKAAFDPKSGITVDAVVKVLGKETPQIAEFRKAFNADAKIRAQYFKCGPVTETTYSCTVSSGLLKQIPHGLYSYTIRATIGDMQVISDPTIMPRS
ncbi:MAG TPA: hypothetical protein PLE54_00845 [Burkholderiaceae bacterium]|nr:hypothetical protein [Burkholderiaceae bacterium]HQR69123.1 hypothetical protein [Burkholderiaceae bacterium]